MRTYCGIDISDRSVEVVALERVGDDVFVSNAVRAEIPAGLIDRGVIQDAHALGTLLGAFLDAHFGRSRRLHAAVCLPDLQVFSKVFSLPVKLDGDLAKQAIMVEAADVIPVPLDSALVYIHPYLPEGDHRDFYFAAVSKDIIKSYQAVMNAARVEVDLFDSEASALARAIVRHVRPAVIADIGARTSLISVVDGGLRMSANPMVGGDVLTESLEERLQLPLEQAESLKRQHGFNPIEDDGRVMLILQKPMVEIVDEIRHTISYYEKKSGQTVQAVIVAGGTSLLPNVVDYLRLNFPKIKLSRGEPFVGVQMGDFEGVEEVKANSILYATAFGLAARLVGLVDEPATPFAVIGHKRTLFDMVTDIFKPSLMAKKMKDRQQAKPAPAVTEDPAALPAPEKTPEPAPEQELPPAPEMPPAPAPEPPPAPELAPEPAPAPAPLPEAEAPVPPVVAAPEAVEAEEAPAEAEATDEEPVGEEEEAEKIPEVPVVPHELPMPDPPSAVVEVPAAVEQPEPQDEPDEAEPEEKDYGLGIGDILTASDANEPLTPMPAEEKTPPAPISTKPGVRRLKIEEILGRRLPQESSVEDANPQEVMEPYNLDEPVTEGRSFPWLTLLLIAMFLLAAGSLYMIIGKYGLPGFTRRATPVVEGQVTPPADATATAAVSGDAAGTSAEQLKPVVMSLLLTLDTKEKSSDRTVVVSRVVETDVSASAIYQSTGSKAAPAGSATSGTRATGTIRVQNAAGRAFTFVEKTRFVTSDGVVFRMKAKQTIAADGETEVQVYADLPGSAGNLGAPQDFTVPGLATTAWAGKVTGHSDSAMVGGTDGGQPTSTVTIVSDEDLTKAKEALTARLAKDAADNFGAMLSKGEAVKEDLMSGKDVSVQAPKAGATATEFKVTLSQRYRAFLVPDEQIMALLTAKLPDLLPSGGDATAYRLGKPIYTVEAYDTKAERVELRVEAPIVGR
jgi:type IV pilus assembly protein PilM